MKQISTLKFAALMLTVFALFTTQKATAQTDDDVTVVGYTKVWVELEAVGGGKVFAAPQDQSARVWREQMKFNQAVPVGSMMDVNFTMYYLYANPDDANGYVFVGWYLDNGDGQFNADDDEFISEDPEHIYLDALPDDAEIFDTQTKAKNSAGPSEASARIFAYFTRGALVGLSYYQDDYLDLHANSGTVWISKKANEPGDEVTVRAIPNDGYQFEYWQDADQLGNIITRENPYTFTVKGGERLYAYFTATNSPVFEFPEEGGYQVVSLWDAWVPTEEAQKNGFHVLVMESEDLTRTDDGKVILDSSKEDCQFDITQWRNIPSIMYGKGKVRFAYKRAYGWARQSDPLVKWSGDNGVSLTGDVIYVYIFVPELGAFIQYGTTDDFNPNAQSSIQVPAKLAYFTMSAFDLTDDQGNIPTVIGLSPETYDRGVAEGETALQQLLSELSGIDGVQMGSQTLRGHKVYTLSGVEMKTTPERGVYIVNGRKVVLK